MGCNAMSSGSSVNASFSLKRCSSGRTSRLDDRSDGSTANGDDVRLEIKHVMEMTKNESYNYAYSAPFHGARGS
jgi:hypothetical protein